MERSKIPMLSRFDAISHIMPYYGQTHRAFLLLSGLCSETRLKLDEFYDEFVTLMQEYWGYIEINSADQLAHLFLPNDLFEFIIKCRYKENSHVLIKFIDNLRKLNGRYFNSNYMHSKIKIRDHIVIDIDTVKRLYAYVNLLKSMRVILCKRDIFTTKVQYESSTLDTNSNIIYIQENL